MLNAMRSLTRRDRQPEIMDQPGLDVARHQQALRGLRRINSLSATARRLWTRIRPIARQAADEISILDVACGGGDVAIRLRQLAKHDGLPVAVAGCDMSATALEFARARAQQLSADVRFFECNVLTQGLDQDYDIVVCSLFLHHLDESEAVELLREFRKRSRRAVLASDLRRSRWGYLLASVGGKVLSRSPVVHVDGPLSVRAAFTMDELRALADRAGLENAAVTRCWPARMVLQWNREF